MVPIFQLGKPCEERLNDFTQVLQKNQYLNAHLPWHVLKVIELCVFVPQSCADHSPEGWLPFIFFVIAGGSIALRNVTGVHLLPCLPALRHHCPGQKKAEDLSQNATSDPRPKGFILWVFPVLAHKISPKDLVTEQRFVHLLNATILKEKSWNGVGVGLCLFKKWNLRLDLTFLHPPPTEEGTQGHGVCGPQKLALSGSG